MVGIGGGVSSEKHDIRLGDVDDPDFEKTVQDGKFTRTGLLHKPPELLLDRAGRILDHHPG
jgi:hypothetical protein